jgi:hypothetical protein
MPKFITIGYGDRDGYDRTDVAVRAVAHAHDAQLRKAGTLMGMAGTPVQVRNTEAKRIDTRTGPFMSCSLPVAASVWAETSRRPYSNPAIDSPPQHATRSDLMTWSCNAAR